MTTLERPFVVVDVPQRSEAWLAARLGRLTSSCSHLVFVKGRKAGEESVQRRDLRIRLACERLIGLSLDDDGWKGVHVQRGVEREDDARLAYEARTGRFVDTVGFLAHPQLLTGASIDGYVNDFEGIVEFKVPKTATHIEYLRSKTAPDEYLPQIRQQLLISGAQWCDFVSYDDRVPEKLRLVIRRVSRNEDDLRAHDLAVRNFLAEVDREMAALRELEGAAA